MTPLLAVLRVMENKVIAMVGMLGLVLTVGLLTTIYSQQALAASGGGGSGGAGAGAGGGTGSGTGTGGTTGSRGAAIGTGTGVGTLVGGGHCTASAMNHVKCVRASETRKYQSILIFSYLVPIFEYVHFCSRYTVWLFVPGTH
jgi:hypothetical protein